MTGTGSKVSAILAVLAITGCGGGRAVPGVATGAPATAAPELDGAAILERACTKCHTLRGLGAYANYWGEPEWRSMVETMIGYGAAVAPAEVPVLVRFLARNYGTAGSSDADSDPPARR